MLTVIWKSALPTKGHASSHIPQMLYHALRLPKMSSQDSLLCMQPCCYSESVLSVFYLRSQPIRHDELKGRALTCIFEVAVKRSEKLRRVCHDSTIFTSYQ